MTEPLKILQNMGIQLYSFILIFIDIFVLLFKFNIEISKSLFQTFVPPKGKSLVGETVVISGTGHGIGKELALQYAALGCKIICIDINENDNRKTVNEINSKQSGSAYHYSCDVTDRAQVLQLGQDVLKDVGPVSVLVNNAGIMPSLPLLKTSESQIRKIFDVNILAHFWMLEAFLPHMISQKRGHIIATSSIAGICGLTNLVPYCASKFAVRGLMEALQEELREDPRQFNIKTTTVFPYMVDTGLCKKPKIRFPGLLGLINPNVAAESIIQAHRQDLAEATIPRYLYHLNNHTRTLPHKCGLLLKDFIDSGVESEM